MIGKIISYPIEQVNKKARSQNTLYGENVKATAASGLRHDPNIIKNREDHEKHLQHMKVLGV